MKFQKPKFQWILLGLMLSLLFVILPARAQSNVAFESVQIDLWPEYDQPEMLVVYRFLLAADVQLPASLSIQIPSAAGTPSAVAEATEDGPMMNIVDYTLVADGNWTIIQLNATQREVQIEYYDPSIQKDGANRSYIYQWPGGYDIGQVILLVQQPIGAEEMEILPRLNDIQVGDKGVVFYRGELGAFGADESFERSIAYKKDADSLSIEFLEIDSPPINEDTTGRVSLVNIIPWGIGLIGVIVIVAGVYWYWATARTSTPTPKKTKRSRQKHTPEADEQNSGREMYCHQCGKRAEGSDKFCRSCGTKLRV